MRLIAESLDCVFVYGLVPRKTLEQTLRNQAAHVATKQISRVAHTMNLEDQGLPIEEQRKAFESLVDEWVRTMPKSLWEDNK